MSLDPRNFDPMRHEWWPCIAAMLSGEWAREAAMMDLRWHAVEVRVFRKAFPSRDRLAKRWGWSDKRVRGLLAKPTEWQDHMHPMSVEDLRGEKGQPRANRGPTEGQPRANAEPTNAENDTERASEGPGKGQARASEGPHARVSPSPTTVTAHREDTQEAPAPAVAPSAPRKPDDAAALHAVYRGHRPRVAVTPTPDSRKALSRILAECGDLDAAATYLAWAFESQDEHARQLRGDAPWPGGQVLARCDPVSLSRNIPPRLAAAQAWDARGRRDAPQVVTFAHPQPRAQVPKTEGLLRHLHQRFLESSNAE